jgi:hypothetical protein
MEIHNDVVDERVWWGATKKGFPCDVRIHNNRILSDCGDMPPRNVKRLLPPEPAETLKPQALRISEFMQLMCSKDCLKDGEFWYARTPKSDRRSWYGNLADGPCCMCCNEIFQWGWPDAIVYCCDGSFREYSEMLVIPEEMLNMHLCREGKAIENVGELMDAESEANPRYRYMNYDTDPLGIQWDNHQRRAKSTGLRLKDGGYCWFVSSDVWRSYGDGLVYKLVGSGAKIKWLFK